jgi:Carboxypeptidase regulatory-like domain
MLSSFTRIPRIAVYRMLSASLSLLLLSVAPAAAQLDRGGIVGTVSDLSGGRIVGAKVTVANIATNIDQVVETNAQGDYSVHNMQIGAYRITAEKAGFKIEVQNPVDVPVNQVVKVDFALSPGSESQTVEVSAAATQLQTQSSSLGTVETTQRISQLPLNGRNFIALAYLGPGANGGQAGSNASGGVFENERADEAISVNGLRVSNNNFLLNGVDNNEFGLGGVIILPPPDAIQEFRTEESAMSAEFGRGGAAVNVVVKSGTNQVHGGVYEFIRNDQLDALNYFAPSRTQFQRNQYGAFVGFPIVKNRTFVFLDYQGTRIRQGLPFLNSVPTPGERTGDFTDRLTGQTFSPCASGGPSFDTGAVFDPYSTASYTCPSGETISLRNQVSFKGVLNVMNPALITSAGSNVINIYPAPNGSGIADNYTATQKQINDQDSGDVRVDHRLRDQDQVFASYGIGDIRSVDPAGLGKLGGSDCCPSLSNIRAQHLGLGYTHLFSSGLLNDLHGGYFRYAVNALPFNYGSNESDQLGIPNSNRGDINSSGLINLDISGETSLGDSEYLPEHVFENIFQLADSVTQVHGMHTLKYGVDFRRQQRNFFQLAVPRGYMNFGGGFTADLSTATGGNGPADLLFGVPQATEQDTLDGLYPTRYWDLAEFVQDDWRIRQNLTINLGLRYEVASPANGRVASFDLTKAVMVASYGQGAVSHAGVGFDKSDWGPRIGFAYSLPHNTVVRSAFGIFYSAEANTFDDLGLNPPALTDLARSYSTGNIPTSAQLISAGFPSTYPVQALDAPQGSVKTTGPTRIMPRILEWNLSVQHEFANNWLAQVAYVGTHAYRLWNHENADLNQPFQPLDSNFSDDTGNFGRPYYAAQPNLASVYPLDLGDLHLMYNSLQASLNHRFSHGFNVLFAYTYASDLGNADGNVAGAIQDAHTPNAEYGPVSPDIRNRFTASYLYQLPVGRGRTFASNSGPILDALIGGWNVAGITTAQSGQSETSTVSSDLSNTGSFSYRYDQLARPTDFSYNTAAQAGLGCTPGKRDILCWYNPAVFTAPALAPGQQSAHAFGNARIGNLRGPNLVDFDFVLQKNFQVKDYGQVEFRSEFFNIFNHPNLGLPANYVDVAGGAAITNTAADNRELEFAIKYSF